MYIHRAGNKHQEGSFFKLIRSDSQFVGTVTPYCIKLF